MNAIGRLSSCGHADPHDELLGARLAKGSVRDIYLTEDPKVARVLLDKAVVGWNRDEVAEIRSLGDSLERWRTEILNHHRTGASNGPTEGLNLCVKKVKRAGRGFTCFEHYRLRVLLHAGGVAWPRRPLPPRIRTPLSPLKRVGPEMKTPRAANTNQLQNRSLNVNGRGVATHVVEQNNGRGISGHVRGYPVWGYSYSDADSPFGSPSAKRKDAAVQLVPPSA